MQQKNYDNFKCKYCITTAKNAQYRLYSLPGLSRNFASREPVRNILLQHGHRNPFHTRYIAHTPHRFRPSRYVLGLIVLLT